MELTLLDFFFFVPPNLLPPLLPQIHALHGSLSRNQYHWSSYFRPKRWSPSSSPFKLHEPICSNDPATLPMAPNALFRTQPNFCLGCGHRLWPQPRIFRLLFQSGRRLLLERCPESPTLSCAALHRLVLHPMGHEAHLGVIDWRFSSSRL